MDTLQLRRVDAHTTPVAPHRPRVRGGGVFVLVAAVAATAAWLPFLHVPLSPDESGFLLLAQHWSPGSSLYGDHWVDRPPLLVWEFWLAGHLAPTGLVAAGVTAAGVKLLGALSSGGSVLLAGWLGGLVAPGSRWSRIAAAVVAATLLSSPRFGMPETDGEILAVPFVLLGLACLLAGLRNPGRRRQVALAAAAGAAAMGAALIKQNEIDVLVVATALLVTTRGRRPAGLRRQIWAFLAGSITTLVVTLASAAARGTSPAGLWDAVVVFRFRASAVLESSATDATAQRLGRLAGDFLASGAAVLLVVTALLLVGSWLHGRRSRLALDRDEEDGPGDLTWPVLALVGWELYGVAAGGSYWLHYLTGLLPGLVLLVAITGSGRRRRQLVAAALGYVVVASLAAWGHHVSVPVTVSPDAQVASYLRERARPSDGVVVAFGRPDIVAASGLTSPYEQLWSLPVRVRDPRLADLLHVMSGPRAPRWMVVAGEGLDTWGVDARSAQNYLARHYVEQVTYGDWHVWLREEGSRP